MEETFFEIHVAAVQGLAKTALFSCAAAHEVGTIDKRH